MDCRLDGKIVVLPDGIRDVRMDFVVAPEVRLDLCFHQSLVPHSSKDMRCFTIAIVESCSEFRCRQDFIGLIDALNLLDYLFM